MPALPAKQFNWDNMTTTAIAELMLYCGQAVKMDYTLTASGASTNTVPGAMRDIFGYSTAANIVQRGSYTDDQWAEMIHRELQEGYPVLYFGQSATDGGHAFIVDGYADGKYHINWGWNGYCDGYFTLDKLNPNMENGFNLGQEMVINAWRPAGAEDTNRPKTVVKGITTSTRFLERTATGEAFPAFTVTTTVESDMSTAATIQTGLALYGDNGIVAMLSQDSHDFTVGGSYTAEKEVTIGADIQPGEYRIVSVNRLNDSDPWLSDQGSSDRYIAVTVAETSMSIQPMPKSEDDEYTIDFGIHTIDGITYQLVSEYDNNRAYVKLYNETEKYKGDIYIPDYVTYQNMEFKIYSYRGIEDFIFRMSPELTSLSSALGFSVDDCPALKSVEIREGVLNMWRISGCPLIESITYPSTCSEAELPQNCQRVKTLTFLYKRGMILKGGTSCLSVESLPSLTDIYIDSDMPPTIEGSTETVNPNVTIHVPQGSLENYKQSAWKDWKIVEDRAAVPVRVNWDYCGQSTSSSTGIGSFYYDNDIEYAMRIPAEHIEAYKGCKISAIEYYTPRLFGNDQHHHDVEYVFITARGKDYIIKQSVRTLRGQWMRIELSQPYTITGEEIFVGIGRHGILSTEWANEDIVEDGFWRRLMGGDYGYTGKWVKNAGYPDKYNHPLSVRALIEGDALPDDIAMSSVKLGDGGNADNTKRPAMAADTLAEMETDVLGRCFTYSIGADGKYYAPQPSQPKKNVTATTESAGKKTISFKVRNRSMRTVRQITLDPYVDGVQQKPITIDTYLPTNWEDNVTLDLPDLAGRSHNMTFNVTDIDGKPDAVPLNSWGEVNYATNSTTYFPRRIVMEEATGTWCGWCPEGMATIEQMSKKYPDNFIAIAIHDDYEMRVGNSYRPLLDMVTNYPYAYIN
ncbi:MAG: C10 family peptidase, partial [Prevotella sp.]|nr:C10 family peptidase [Prevotella sp.]